jgi:hypothetical protein
VIVKKIARSKASPAKSKAAHVRALADYIAGPQAGGHGEKVEHRGALNLLNLDHDGQVEEMIDLAETARRSPQPVQHWILSWREGEQPTTAQADEAVKMFLGEMGLAEHQAIYALHRDTHNWHLHLAINRVHPDTEKLMTVNGRFDHEIAHRVIARIEHRQGWEPEAYALYGPDTADQITRLRPRDPTDRKVAVNARDFEERRGERSAERVAIEDAAPIIRQATSWCELHEGLAAQGIRFETKGSGALLWIGDQPVKASAAGRDCSMAALRKRLREFEHALSPSAHVPVTPRPVDVSRPSLPSYIAERHKHLVACTQGRELTTARQREEWGSLVDRHRQERADIFRGSWRGKRDLLSALRSVTAARQAQEKADLRDRQRLEHTAIARERGSFPSYEEWLAARDLDAADNWRHRQRRPATIEGPTFKVPVPHDIRAVRAVVDGSKVNYYMARARGAPSFTDCGKTIDVYDTRSRESILAALQLSAQKWGTISVHGNDEFKRTCVELAAEHGFKITNPGLQQAIAAERERLRLMRRPDPPDRRAGALPQTPAAIYRRHLSEIIREQPQRRVDPSRLDGEVAVRMAVTGHSREAISKAIREGAHSDRPNEKRHWGAYAERAVSHAFSPPGQEMQARLRDQEQKFIRLESRDGEIDPLRRLGGPLKYL